MDTYGTDGKRTAARRDSDSRANSTIVKRSLPARDPEPLSVSKLVNSPPALISGAGKVSRHCSKETAMVATDALALGTEQPGDLPEWHDTETAGRARHRRR